MFVRFYVSSKTATVEIFARLWYNSAVKVKVFAKINLTLAVYAKSGFFHPIDSVVTSVDVYDTVEVTKRRDDAVYLQCDDALLQQNNSALRAAKAFQQSFSTRGVTVSVQKGIPVAAGMGGSSADAAATVYCMCKLFGVDANSPQVHELCASLGSDVNFMLRGGFARMRGKGDDVVFSELCKPMYFALTCFDKQLLAADIYDAFDRLNGDVQRQFADASSLYALLADTDRQNVLSDAFLQSVCGNDLQSAAQQFDRYAERYAQFVQSVGYKCTLTGSGSAYFVPFEHQEHAELAVRLLNDNGFVSRVCRSVPCGIAEQDE